jgi:hypothetical protein
MPNSNGFGHGRIPTGELNLIEAMTRAEDSPLGCSVRPGGLDRV